MFQRKSALSVFGYSNYLQSCEKSEKNNNLFLGKTPNRQFKQSNLTLNCLNLIDSRITFKFLLGFPVLQTFWEDVESCADLNLFFSPNLLQEFEILNCNFAYTGDDNNENFPSLEPTWVQHKNFLRW